MPRMARVVAPGYPHHVTQRGNRRQRTFFRDADYEAYIELLRERKGKAGVEVWAYCLMPNHVHVVAVPERKESLGRLFGVIHHVYAWQVNADNNWRGHLWQERFHSCVMNDAHLFAAVRYIELNPVRAGLCAQAEDWRWSSVHAHIDAGPDDLVSVEPMRQRVSDWRRYLLQEDCPQLLDSLRKHTRTGHPAGDESFIGQIEGVTGRTLRRRKPGPKSGC